MYRCSKEHIQELRKKMEKEKREFWFTVIGLVFFITVISYITTQDSVTAQVVTKQTINADRVYAYGSNNTNATNHTECRNSACVVIQGRGENQCKTNANCPTYGIAPGNYTNQTIKTHGVCLGFACVQVGGAGVDLCIDYRDCMNTTNVTWKVFVTNATVNGANASSSGTGICNAEAAAKGYPGTYTTWLSTSTLDARNKIVPGVYKNIYGSVIAYSRMDLLDGTLNSAIDPFMGGAYVWTGTLSNGKYSGINCLDWTSIALNQYGKVGNADITNYGWTDSAGRRCDTLNKLYCFQVR